MGFDKWSKMWLSRACVLRKDEEPGSRRPQVRQAGESGILYSCKVYSVVMADGSDEWWGWSCLVVLSGPLEGRLGLGGLRPPHRVAYLQYYAYIHQPG
jgi:hypothetical protein